MTPSDGRRRGGVGERAWTVHHYGFDSRDYMASTAGAARYQRFRAYREAGYSGSFYEFMLNTRVEPSRRTRGREDGGGR